MGMRVMRSFGKCSVRHEQLCRSIGDEVVVRLKEKALGGFKCEDLCEICWTFCVLQFYHEELFRRLFKELERVPQISTDALCMIYELHLALESEHKDEYSRYSPPDSIVNHMQDHYKESRKDERRCSERQRNDIAGVLKSLVDGSVHVNHRTSTGLLVDVAALRKRSSVDGFIHIDLESNITVVRSLDQDESSQPPGVIVEGPVALRRRILGKNGLRLIEVKESDWRILEDGKEKRRHLRTLL